MNLETEIQQKKAISARHKLLVNIFFTHSWLYNKELKLLKHYDLSPEQYNVLRILRGQFPKEVSVKVIAERMIDRNSNASRIVDKLKAKQLVTRKNSQSDRRLVDILITKQGLALLEQLDEIIERFIDENLGQISEEESDMVNQLLDKIRK